jgi:hypothetical protein
VLQTTISRAKQDRTFIQHLQYNAIWWGIPMLLLELVGIPWRLWIDILLIAFPMTALGVLCKAALEFIVIFRKKN